MRSSIIAALLAFPAVAAAQPAPVPGDPVRDLAVALGAAWQVTARADTIALDTVVVGWGLREYCAEQLPAEARRRLEQLPSIIAVLGGLAAERDVTITIAVTVAGEADATAFDPDRPLGRYECDGAALDTGDASDDQERLAGYRALTVERAVEGALATGGSAAVRLGPLVTSGTWFAAEPGPHRRGATLRLLATLAPSPSPLPHGEVIEEPPPAPQRSPAVDADDAPGETRPSDGDVSRSRTPPRRSSLSLGASGGVLSPLTGAAREHDFGLLPQLMVAARWRLARPGGLIVARGQLARRADGMVEINDRSEHYQLWLAAVGAGYQLDLRRGALSLAIGPHLDVVHLRRHLVLNSSARDQSVWTAGLGLGIDASLALTDRVRLWLSVGGAVLVLDVPGGVDHPAMGSTTLGLLHDL